MSASVASGGKFRMCSTCVCAGGPDGVHLQFRAAAHAGDVLQLKLHTPLREVDWPESYLCSYSCLLLAADDAGFKGCSCCCYTSCVWPGDSGAGRLRTYTTDRLQTWVNHS
eukprot:GHRQ01027237.1.p1 GENE.GHRQ01027237.1~~GHRQ01027237.1.p1  ORF type:complete len:111 (+),score=1.45 GHRQ01027237.1:328-660(+)